MTDSIPVDFFDDGLLWLINKSLLHPRGYALGVDVNTKEMTLLGNGSEPWRFELPNEDDLFQRVEQLFTRAAEYNRD